MPFLKNDRFNLVFVFMMVFIAISFISRTALMMASFDDVDLSLLNLIKIYGIGAFYDFVASTYYVIPFVIYLILIPNKLFNAKIHKVLALGIYFSVLYGVIFNGFSEWFFWDEFGKRFNFIAVDYLVYTTEVLQNIWESYPIPLLVSIILVFNLGLFYLLSKKTTLFVESFTQESTFMQRAKKGLLLLVLPVLFFNILDQQKLTETFSNKFNAELSKNGLYSLFSAFRNNTLDYDEFYATLDINDVMLKLRTLLKSKDSSFVSKDLKNIQREFKAQGEEKHYNVMLIMIESLSASYMGIYGNTKNLTPYIDSYAKKSLFFNKLYATGTRTVRGMEAVTLSVPPTPGRSIVKRPDNHNLSSVGFIFANKGYENKFIYGGHGYFDNMNDFFGNNGFNIVDRNSFSDDEITFANVWGVCDENLFDKTLKEADKSFAKKKPFFNFIMTTSNHRPYTFPRDKMDQPKREGRDSGVNYTDYAVKKFFEDAAKKPWFDDTIFVLVADHNGGSSGSTDLPVYRYLIPAFFYAPKIIEPQTISKLSSQIDLMPTLLSLMNWDYNNKAYGNNILAPNFQERAFIGTYQKLGLLRDDKLTVLFPNASAKSLQISDLKLNDVTYIELEKNKKDIADTITYFQSATYLYKNKLNRQN